MSKKYPCPSGIEDDCGYPACAHAMRCEIAAPGPSGGGREIENLRVALKDATELLGEIMRDEVNHQDEAEKWLRAYAPHHLFPQNDLARPLATDKANEK